MFVGRDGFEDGIDGVQTLDRIERRLLLLR
jgi:hypothetical protein